MGIENQQSWFRKIYRCCLLSSLCTIYVWVVRYYPVYWYEPGTNINNFIKLIIGTFPSIVSYGQGLFTVWQLTQSLADNLVNKPDGIKFENVDVQGNWLTQIKVQPFFRIFIMLIIYVLSLILVSAVSQTGAIAVFNKGEQYITSTTDPASAFNTLNIYLTELSQLDNGAGVMMLLFSSSSQGLWSSYGGGKVETFLISNYSSYVITNEVKKPLPYINTTKIFTGSSNDGILSILYYEQCEVLSVTDGLCNNNNVIPTYINSWNTNSFELQQTGIAKPDKSGCSTITISCTYNLEFRNGSIHTYGSNHLNFRGDTAPVVDIPNAIDSIDYTLKTVMFALANSTLNINTEVAQMATFKLQLVSYNNDMSVDIQDTAFLSIITNSLTLVEATTSQFGTSNVKLVSQTAYSDYFGGLVVPDWQVYTILIYPVLVIATGIYLSIKMHKNTFTAIVGGWISNSIALFHNISTVIYKPDANNTIDNQLVKEYKNVYIKANKQGLDMVERN